MTPEEEQHERELEQALQREQHRNTVLQAQADQLREALKRAYRFSLSPRGKTQESDQ